MELLQPPGPHVLQTSMLANGHPERATGTKRTNLNTHLMETLNTKHAIDLPNGFGIVGNILMFIGRTIMDDQVSAH